MLERFIGHDLATTRELLVLSNGLTNAQLDRPLGLDFGRLRSSLLHLVEVMEQWTDLMLGRKIRYLALPANPEASVAELLQRFDTVAAEFTTFARRAQAEGQLEATFVDWDEQSPRHRTIGAGIGHVITHNGSHRAHIAAILKQLGVVDVPEGDMLGWERRLRGGWQPASRS